MTSDVLLDIVDSCVSLDQNASQIYLELSEHAENEDLQHFWTSMANEEKKHVGYWQALRPIIESIEASYFFENPYTIKHELENILAKSHALLEKSRNTSDVCGAFIIAYRLEFYMLHPAFETLLCFLRAPALRRLLSAAAIAADSPRLP